MHRREVSIILPALNEEESIGKVIDERPKRDVEKEGYRVEILVVDNDSTDRTKEVAEEKGAKVILEPGKRKASAVSRAFGSVMEDFICILDADPTYPATHIPKM